MIPNALRYILRKIGNSHMWEPSDFLNIISQLPNMMKADRKFSVLHNMPSVKNSSSGLLKSKIWCLLKDKQWIYIVLMNVA